MNVLDFSTSNAQVTNEIINVSDANPITIKHDTFYNKVGKAILISTAPSGGGTVLVNPLDGASDYTPGGAYTFPEPYNTTLAGDVGYTTIAITNATYHNTDLYVSYYPIWDLLYAARWNNKNIIPVEGNFDISASNETFDLTTVNSYPIGYEFKVLAYDGDGSNNFSFVDNGETINGITVADYSIDGTGGFIMKKIDDGEFSAVGWLGGDIFDQDGGNFASGVEKFSKRIDGTMRCQALATSTYTTNVNYPGAYVFRSGAESFTFPLAFVAVPELSPAPQYSSTRILWQGASAMTASTVDCFLLCSYNDGVGYPGYIAEGRWTSNFAEAA